MIQEDIYITVPWGCIASRWYGNRKVRPILALHGWLDNLGTWDRLVRFLPPHIGLLCVDLPGHGRSSRYPNGMSYYLIDFVDIILRIKKEYNWEKVSLLGHSLGGVVCFFYTALYPKTVDMLIQLDILLPPIRDAEFMLRELLTSSEKSLIENERLEQEIREPRLYTYEQLEEKLYLGSNKSIDRVNCKYLLNRSIKASALYPDKYNYICDARIKYYHVFYPPLELMQKMTERLKDVNYLLIRYTNSGYTSEHMIDTIRKIHTKMQVQDVNGLHHAHLNNPKEVAAKLMPFILKIMPESKKLKNNLCLKTDDVTQSKL